jgi:hypothetical protein
MRCAATFLACLAPATAGCLHQVAPLLGDGGDAGIACDWRSAGDAGLCTSDSQCPTGYYCDFSESECSASWDGGASPLINVVDPGLCLPVCAGAPCANGDWSGDCGPCNVGEDCSTWQICYEGRLCTVQEPCDAGVCTGTGQVPDSCESPCGLVSVPHSTWAGCVCPGNTCNVPQVLDAGNETCSFELLPNPLDFSFVRCGTTITVPLTIRDVGQGECLVTGLTSSCVDGGGPINLPGGPTVSQRLSPPDGGPYPNQLVLQIPFSCAVDAGPFSCEIQVFVNGMQLTLPLSGACCLDGG